MNTNNVKFPSFMTKGEAIQWVHREADDGCIDNTRFAYLDDVKAMEEYNKQIDEGCCGSMDRVVYVMGRKATVGCNFGH